MNKHLLLAIGFSSICFMAAAQITLNQGDFVTPGKMVENANDTLPDASIFLVGTGAQTWDFSLLHSHTFGNIDYVDPSTTPYASTFPTSNLCAETGPAYGYYVSSTSAITGLGGHADFTFGTNNISITLKNSPAETLINFPATYNSTFASNYTSSGKTPFVYTYMGFSSDSAKFVSVNKKTTLFDAYGNMTTPLGTYATVRAKEYVTSVTTISLRFPFLGWQNVNTTNDTTTTYKWFANGLGAELVSANFNDSLGKIDYVTWMYTLSAGVKDISHNVLVKAFPSPANDVVYVENSDPNSKVVLVADINGKQILTQQIDNKITPLNTSDLAPGFYVYSVKGVKNVVIATGKIVITR